MIDLETLGISPKAPIISIGACFFDTEIRQTYYRILDVEEQITSRKRFADGSTIKWWMGQEKAAQKVFKEGALPTKQVLTEFRAWILQIAKKNAKPWGNGSNFDITLMESIFEDYDLKNPWSFRNIRDLRTFKSEVYNGKGMALEGTAHNALDDAIYQAKLVIEGRKRRDAK